MLEVVLMMIFIMCVTTAIFLILMWILNAIFRPIIMKENWVTINEMGAAHDKGYQDGLKGNSPNNTYEYELEKCSYNDRFQEGANERTTITGD